MTTRTTIISLSLCLWLSLLLPAAQPGVASPFTRAKHHPTPSSSPPTPPWLDPTLPTATRVSALLGNMTTDEKLSQMIKEAAAIPRLSLPFFSYWCEAAHGIAGDGLATVFPASSARACSFDPNTEEAIGRVVALEGRAKRNVHINQTGNSTDGYSMTLYAPVINVVRDIRWGRSQETFGEDPHLTGQLGAAYIRGLQHTAASPALPSKRYAASSAMAKHFVAYDLESDFAKGGTNANYRFQFDADISYADLLQTYAPAFREAIFSANVSTIMCSYNAVWGTPMCASGLLQSYLREGLQWPGTIFSDGGAVRFIYDQHNFTEDIAGAAAAALNAGVDLNSGGANSDFGYKHLSEALSRGLITTDQIDAAVTRLMTLRIDLGLLDPPGFVPFSTLNMSSVDTPTARQLARSSAANGIVLLKNKDAFIPLSPEGKSIRRIAVIGPNADRKGALLSNYAGCREPFDGPITPACRLVTPLQGIRAYAANHSIIVDYAEGCRLNTTNATSAAEAEKLASIADVSVVVLGLSTSNAEHDAVFEAEAHDRVDIALPPAQESLLQQICKNTDKVVLVLMSGGPVSVKWAATNDCVRAIVNLGYPGEEGGNALADVLFGQVAPSGRMAMTTAAGVDDLPDYFDMEMIHGHTYRYWNRTATQPLFSFGFGMTTTTFSYSQLEVTTTPEKDIHVSVRVANLGPVDSDEVTLVFISLNASSPIDRSLGCRRLPFLELKAFARTHIPSGESRSVELTVLHDRLELVDDDCQSRLLPGTYTVYVGGRQPGSPGSGVDLKAFGVPHKPLTKDVVLALS